ncbi:MAG: hypothetical protein GF307_04610 [candidate division Zixibacteria bacterium]|nr:hypothetical protein [candidate division Zixibacteria bacterium]
MVRITSGILLLALITFMFFYSCGPKPPGEKPGVEEAAIPEITGFTISTEEGNASFLWNTTRQKGETIGGYDIFMVPEGENPGEPVKPLNETPYPGDVDADPTRETFKFSNAEPGKIYKTWVRLYSADGENYVSSDTIIYSPVYKGQIVLNLRWSVRTSSYDFSRRSYVPARSLDSDIMIMSGKGEPKIYSPNRMNDDFRRTVFADPGLKYEDLNIFNPESYDWQESLPLERGNTYLMRTADGHYAKLKCARIEGEGGRLQATFIYCYIPARGYYKFL